MEALSYTLQDIEDYFSQLSKEEQAHCLRVEDLSIKLAKAMNLPVKKHNELAQAAKYHDIGKIKIPRRILEKPGKLTTTERNIVMVHSKFSGQILEQSGFSREVVRFALLHHENYDGSGYPFGYAFEKIPIEARIIRVADAFDALHSKRPYKNALSIEMCLNIMAKEEHFYDPNIMNELGRVVI